MKKTTILLSSLLISAILLAGCNLPFGYTLNPPAEPGTPNATLTALFNPNQNIPATITPPVIATSTAVLPTVELATATATLEPTQTVAPTETATNTPVVIVVTATTAPTAQPVARPNAQLYANYLGTAPVQDGTYAEWVDKTYKYAMPGFAWGKANWVNHDDLEGAFAVGWDTTNLYIGYKITDDIYNQPYAGGDIYNGDTVEILLDTDLLGDFYTTKLTTDDYQLGLSAGSPSGSIESGAYLWYPSSVAGKRSQVVVSKMFESSTVYRIEAAIPWSVFGITPYAGMRVGFAVNVDDNDNVDSYKKMTMLSSASGLYVQNPTTWGELVLVK